MADTITIPSPSVFLTESTIASHPSPPKPASAPAKPKQQRKRNPAAAKAKTATDKPGEAAAVNGVDKKKQTKSRYGQCLYLCTRILYISLVKLSCGSRLCNMQSEETQVRRDETHMPAMCTT